MRAIAAASLLPFLRILVATAITVGTAVVHYYPTLGWIGIVVAVLGFVATHVIPSVGQGKPPTPPPTIPTDIYPYSTGDTPHP